MFNEFEFNFSSLYQISCEEYYDIYSPSYEGGEKFDDDEIFCYNNTIPKEENDYESLY